MKKMLVIYPDYSEKVTGGQVYDRLFIKSLQEKEDLSVEFLLDKDLFSQNKFLFIIAYILKLGKCCKYDYILTNSRLYTRLFALFFILRILGKKIYSIHHHFSYLGESGWRYFIHKTLETFFLRISTATILASPYVKDCFSKMLPKSKYIYVPLGVKKSKRDALNRKDITGTVDLLYVGTIEKRKGLLYLLESLNKLSTNKEISYKCHIVGKVLEEDYKREMDNKIKEYNLTDDIIFHGRLDDEELNRIYSESDIFVFPSMLEGYGMVLLEAMSYSLPIIAFDNSAMPYTVKTGETGILVENKNVDSFYRAIVKLVEDKDYYSNIVENSKKRYEEIRTEESLKEDIIKTIDLVF